MAVELNAVIQDGVQVAMQAYAAAAGLPQVVSWTVEAYDLDEQLLTGQVQQPPAEVGATIAAYARSLQLHTFSPRLGVVEATGGCDGWTVTVWGVVDQQAHSEMVAHHGDGASRGQVQVSRSRMPVQ